MVNCKTLHEAIIFVLESNNNRPMSFDEIAEEIKSQNLWKRKKDNKFPPSYQIMLRTKVQKAYKSLFVVKDDYVKLNR
jgi:hypothetical protein